MIPPPRTRGVGRDLGVETIVDLSRWATADLVPDATLLLSVPLSAEQERMDQRGTVDRIEAEGAAFKARIHGAFEQIAVRTLTVRTASLTAWARLSRYTRACLRWLSRYLPPVSWSAPRRRTHESLGYPADSR